MAGEITKETSDSLPEWVVKMIRRQAVLNKKYEFAHNEFAKAYNDFLNTIEEINMEHGTEFTFQQAVEEYQGEFACDVVEEDDDEEDDDEDEED